MDAKRESMIPHCGNLPDIGKNKVVVGAKQLQKALRRNAVERVFLAKNADPAITEALAQQCMDASVALTWVETMRQLGDACGIEVGAAAAAVLK